MIYGFHICQLATYGKLVQNDSHKIVKHKCMVTKKNAATIKFKYSSLPGLIIVGL